MAVQDLDPVLKARHTSIIFPASRCHSGHESMSLGLTAWLDSEHTHLGGQQAEVTSSTDMCDALDILGIPLIAACAPEHHTVLLALSLREGIHQGVSKVGPEVAVSHAGEEYVAVNCQCQTQAAPLPGYAADAAAWDPQSAQVLAHAVVELHKP